MPAHPGELKDVIEVNYHCHAEHVSSAAVIEMRGCEMLWKGMVEVFDVVCYLPVKRCYAWSEGPEWDRLIMTVLELPPIHSAGAAVRDAIASAEKSRHRRVARPDAPLRFA
jgi:hypothetical protein